jgi:NDP-sugar pyrophosphorylase family protein
MAGGRGLRLDPITQRTPKPLLRVGSKPILEQILERFVDQGFRHFILSVNYLAEMIEDHFGDGRKWGVEITYQHEDEPMGSGGALSLINPQSLTEPFIVANGDVIADIDYRALLDTHKRNAACATMAVAWYQMQVPFGVAKTDGERLLRLAEKPIEGFMVNAGIYAFSKRALDHIEGETGMTDILDKLDVVAVHPVEGYWHDVGSFESMARATQDIHR